MLIEKAIEETINRKNLTVLIYAGLNLWLLENIKDRKKHFIYLMTSLFGLEVLLNYLDDSEEMHKKYHELEYETLDNVSYYDVMEN